MSRFIAAVVQAAPVAFDKARTLQKLRELAAQADAPSDAPPRS